MNVLIVYTNYGTGHQRAAEALKQEFERKNFDGKVEILDSVTFSRPFINSLFRNTGKVVATKFRKLRLKFYNKKMYNITNKSIFADFCTKLFWNKKIMNKINTFKPDLIVSTQVGPTYILVKHKNEIGNPKIATIFTDYGLHNWHLLGNNDVNYYFVPTFEIKKQMIEFGIIENKIKVLGIPTLKEFNPNLYKKEDIRKQYNIDKNKPLFLFVAGGGMGYANALSYFEELLKIEHPFSYVFVAGKNKKLKLKAETIAKNSMQKGIVLGYTNEMPNLLSLCDMIIGKPGGLITTECLEMNIPICVVEPIPGQELKNAEFIIKNEFGIYPKNKIDFQKNIEAILTNKKILLEMKKHLKEYQNKKGVENIVNILLREKRN